MYRRNVKGWAKHLDFIIWDMLCLIVAFFWAYFIRMGIQNPLATGIYRKMFWVLLVFDFLLILFLDTMKNVLKRGYYKEFVATLWQSLALLVSGATYLFGMKMAGAYSRIHLFLMIMIYAVLSYVTRVLWKKALTILMREKTDNALLIVANESNAQKLVTDIEQRNFGWHKLVGIVLPNGEEQRSSIADIPVVAGYETIADYVARNWVDEILIYVAEDERIPVEMIDDLSLMGVTVHLCLDQLVRMDGMRQSFGNVGGMQVITSSMNFMTPRQYALKRIIDIAGGLVGCLITGILYLILAPQIKRESPGPVFFAQTRIGKNGKPFKFYKFRSMYLDAEERKAALMEQNRVKDGLMFKMEFDPRVIGNKIDDNGNQVTGIGEFIRKYSLDEFPQFINVLKGDMSIVGTRPPLPNEYAAYSAHHKARLAAKPGITGMWQVSGRSNILDFEEVVRLDTDYINKWTIGLDIKIILKTILVVLKKEGSM